MTFSDLLWKAPKTRTPLLPFVIANISRCLCRNLRVCNPIRREAVCTWLASQNPRLLRQTQPPTFLFPQCIDLHYQCPCHLRKLLYHSQSPLPVLLNYIHPSPCLVVCVWLDTIRCLFFAFYSRPQLHYTFYTTSTACSPGEWVGRQSLLQSDCLLLPCSPSENISFINSQ